MVGHSRRFHRLNRLVPRRAIRPQWRLQQGWRLRIHRGLPVRRFRICRQFLRGRFHRKQQGRVQGPFPGKLRRRVLQGRFLPRPCHRWPRFLQWALQGREQRRGACPFPLHRHHRDRKYREHRLRRRCRRQERPRHRLVRNRRFAFRRLHRRRGLLVNRSLHQRRFRPRRCLSSLSNRSPISRHSAAWSLVLRRRRPAWDSRVVSVASSRRSFPVFLSRRCRASGGPSLRWFRRRVRRESSRW